ncbi:MAG: hypothetical protein IJG45_02685 [Oscillospiraceae bacterium]|nr:hypothetical protein [Oscillospiraceae bacterium]
MGHERIGFIPKTKQWRAIVSQLQGYNEEDAAVAKVASDTLDALRGLYNSLPYDKSIIASVRFLTILCRYSNDTEKLKVIGIENGSELSMYSLLRGVNQYLSSESDSLETGKLAKDSLMRAIITYQQVHETNQLSFDSVDSECIWNGIDSGAAFCEMARSFVAEFTERNLNYYLERIAASEIRDYSTLISFNHTLKQQSAAIATHSQEISKLMQSFAAGWYNKHSSEAVPNDKKIIDFLSVTFKKIKEEFRREGAEQ